MQTIEIFHTGQKQVNGRVFPQILTPESNTSHSKEELLEWGKNNQKLLREELMKYGAILLRGFSFSCPEDFELFLDVSGFSPITVWANLQTLVF